MIRKIVVILVITSICYGCQSELPYSGDGTLIDFGVFNANHRYILDLGSVSLNQEHQYAYSINNLPEKNFVFGLELKLDPPEREFFEHKSIDCTLKFVIADEKGKILLSEFGNIKDWVWNIPATGEWCFIYGRSELGSYFTPRLRQNYKIMFNITNTQKGTTYPVKLIGKTSGWK